MSEYFTHDYNARNDPKILELRAEYGWEGYGVWWAFVEALAENGGSLNRSQIGGVSLGLGVAKGWLEGWLKGCLNLGLLFEDEDGNIQSERLNAHLKKREKLREAGRRGGLSNKESEGGLKGGSKDPPSSKGKESKEKVKKKNSARAHGECGTLLTEEEMGELRGPWLHYLDYRGREKKGKFKSAQTERKALKNLHELSGGDEKVAQKIVEQSEQRTWTGLFPLKDQNHGKTSQEKYRGFLTGNG